MPSILKAGKTYSLNQEQYTLDCMLEDNDQYCCGMAHNKEHSYFQIKQYKQPLTDGMKATMRVLGQQDLPVPSEAREIVRGRAVKYENCVVEPHSGLTLTGFLNHGSETSHVDKAIALCQFVQSIHSKGYVLGNINLSNIEVTSCGLKPRTIEFAQKTNADHEKEHDLQQLSRMVLVVPEIGASLLQFHECDNDLKTAIMTHKLQANQLGAFLVLNMAGNNAYQRVIDRPWLADDILVKYNQYKDNPSALNVAIKGIIQGSFKKIFDEIRHQRSTTPDSNASTILPEFDDFGPTPPNTPRIN